ncbi:HugZ family protein [Marinicella meishanensis]|uniref:HugZ family pyridoxamine 5'-phosphate oxidase n=1 Tax=Marinicella meishanensis TaxID=2873263 RepID=UPI001CC04A69|nr:DUF2470 domain-containing protein [Marinicella sp. NBU2979]
MNRKTKATTAARNLLRSQEKALLSTHSYSKTGYPFGSVTTYMTDHQGHPIIYISYLAQHTKNIQQNPQMSLLVNQDHTDDINAGARLTLLGRAERVSSDESAALAAKFFLKFPESQQYQDTHDFEFYRIRVEYVRYIGGFGQIFWLDVNQFILPQPDWLGHEQAAIDHMNEDHQDAMKFICSYYRNFEADHIRMTHLYADGCVLQANEQHNHFLPFPAPVMQAQDIRIQLVQMTQQARAKLTPAAV